MAPIHAYQRALDRQPFGLGQPGNDDLHPPSGATELDGNSERPHPCGMKIVSWNIRHGGGSGPRATAIAQMLTGFDADILVVPEFRGGRAGTALCNSLWSAGYKTSHPRAEESKNTVLIASRQAINDARTLDASVGDPRHLWMVTTCGLRLVGVYMPVGAPKLPYWSAVVSAALDGEAPDLFVGDFNTGTNNLDKAPGGTPFLGPEFMTRIAEAGFVDLWRMRHPEQREYTWFSAGGKNGFRLDHAFGSSRLHDAVTACYYDHEPRVTGISDHSAMVVEIGNLCAVPSRDVIGCIYALADPGCPGLIKIGKDQKWPIRLRQAQAHTPRGMAEVGRWNIRGDRSALVAAEGQALTLFPREQSCPGREWVRASASEVIEKLQPVFGKPEPFTDITSLRPFDDWRDYERPPHSRAPRWVWIGQENNTDRLKVVHSPNAERFSSICPTYSRHGISWGEAWGWPAETWAPSPALNELDQRLVKLWTEITGAFGSGPRDIRLGWLREGTLISDVRRRLVAGGLVVQQTK